MSDPSRFRELYFMQTRREIESEKKERDTLLHYAVIVLGALAFAFVQRGEAREFMSAPYALPFAFAGLVIVTALFWTRRTKLQQIADRWHTLWHVLESYPDHPLEGYSLEQVAVRGLECSRYSRKDLMLNYALCLPLYAVLFAGGNGLPWGSTSEALIPLALLMIHATGSALLLGRRLSDPFAPSERCRPTRAFLRCWGRFTRWLAALRRK